MNDPDGGEAQVQKSNGPLSVREAVRHLVPSTRPDAAPRRGRALAIAGEAWIACIAGRSAVGTGTRGHAFLTAIHFFRADAPDQPMREALLPRGHFDRLFEEELRALFHEARPIATHERREA